MVRLGKALAVPLAPWSQKVVYRECRYAASARVADSAREANGRRVFKSHKRAREKT